MSRGQHERECRVCLRKEAVVSDGSIEIVTMGAIRLALEGAADDETALRMVKWLVDQAPDTEQGDTASVKLFIEGIRALGIGTLGIKARVVRGVW